MIYDVGEDKCYSDLTGRFPFKSSRGNNYILVVYHFDGNAILAQCIKNREADTVSTAWETVVRRIKSNNLPPKHFVMDNETSNLLQ